MINIYSEKELDLLREAGHITGLAREYAGSLIKPGITTKQLDTKIKAFIRSHGAEPSFLGYNGFTGSACLSVNEEVIHGIPSDRALNEGDIIKVDVGAYYKGFHGDCAATFGVGRISREAERLIAVTRECFFKGIDAVKNGGRIGDISYAVFRHASDNGFGVVKDYIGHGVGRKLHEDPEVPNYGPAGRGPRLQAGMVIAIEPMINMGTWKVRTLSDNWTVVTEDGLLSSHYENTVAVTKSGIEILTMPAL